MKIREIIPYLTEDNIVNFSYQIKGYKTKPLLHLINFLCKDAKYKNFIEFGFYYGRTCLIPCFYSKNNCSYTINIDGWVNYDDESKDNYSAMKEEFQFNTLFLNEYSSNINLSSLRFDSEMNVNKLGFGYSDDIYLYHKCSYIHIDGGHDYNTIFEDLRQSDSMLDTYGVILIDDFCNYMLPSVTSATYKFMEQYGYEIIVTMENNALLCRKSYINYWRNKIFDKFVKYLHEVNEIWSIIIYNPEMNIPSIVVKENGMKRISVVGRMYLEKPIDIYTTTIDDNTFENTIKERGELKSYEL